MSSTSSKMAAWSTRKNGVKITSFPAIHVLDGAVSYRLDWNGLSFVFGGDSAPNKWFIEHSQGADFVIHECFLHPQGLETALGFPPRQATFVSSYIHTPPAGFGKDHVRGQAAAGRRLPHDPQPRAGPDDSRGDPQDVRRALVIADDLMCWTITKDAIVQREVVSAERVQAPPTTRGLQERPSGAARRATPSSPTTASGKATRPRRCRKARQRVATAAPDRSCRNVKSPTRPDVSSVDRPGSGKA